MKELDRAVTDFRAKGSHCRAIVVINPGNPTGSVLTRKDMTQVLAFAEKEGLAVLADEVSQDSVHVDDKEFVSFRQLACDLGTKVEVFSLHSTSKSLGEGGLRGGFFHCHNVKPEVMDQLHKLSSISLCSNTMGQAMVASALTPPPIDGPSRASFDQESDTVRTALRRKAEFVTERLNGLQGVTCQRIEGGMYAFPRIIIKGYIMKKAISYATVADEIYCLDLLERTGILAIPGSGFGQRPGHFHLRLTILPQEETLRRVLDRFDKFHVEHPGGWFR